MTDTILFAPPDKAFIPLSEVEAMLAQSPVIPYASVFSLEPYLDVIKSKMCNACDYTKSALFPVLKTNQDFLEAHDDEIASIIEQPQFQTIMSMVVPSMMFNNELSYIAPPFTKKFIVKSPAFETFIDSGDWLTLLTPEQLEDKHNMMVVQAGIHILNTYYKQDIPPLVEDLFTLKNKKTKLIRYFRMELNFDFVKLDTIGKIPNLSKAQIAFLLKNPDDTELWLKTLPPENFRFRGFCVGKLYDITDIQVLSDLKQWLSYEQEMAPRIFFDKLSHFIRSYIGVDDVMVGDIILDGNMSIGDANISLTGIKDTDDFFAEASMTKGIYDHMLSSRRVLYVEDLKQLENPSLPEEKLLRKGFRSFVLSPMLNEKSEVLAFLELGSKKANAFNSWNVKKLQEVFNQLILNFEKFKSEYDNRITGVIQKNFTSIHPSVSWKFEDAARNYYRARNEGGEELAMPPIVFNDVFPLYAQSDIVHSSSIRNDLIKADLESNVDGLIHLIKHWLQKKQLHLLESYLVKLEQTRRQLDEGFVSSDETKIVGFITSEVHPLIRKMAQRFDALHDKEYRDYISLLDEKLDIIYSRRKDFERSVNRLNTAISEYIESEEQKMQEVLPHYFERYKTDGVEYNIYLGQSILRKGQFDEDDLMNFKLWQLVSSIEISRLVHKISPTLPVKLTTAELIFVYNHALSIRFRMDEKKFDVDGAYNVRYEILKKRIDKATIKSTGERLTQSGKIAIVYLSESDRNEYMEFFDYLIAKGYIEKEIEDLELNDLQGAEGLNALRITVKQTA